MLMISLRFRPTPPSFPQGTLKRIRASAKFLEIELQLLRRCFDSGWRWETGGYD